MDYIDACTHGSWSIETYSAEDGTEKKVRAFKCHSWRHEGPCREWCADCDFARVNAALASRQWWTYSVLTYPARKWPNVTELFRFGVIHWSRLRKRLTRKFGKVEYIQTWEVHKSGYPHINVAISNESLYLLAERDFMGTKSKILDPMAQEVGFGFWRWFEPMRKQEGLAGYLVKKAAEITGAHGKDQLPINAPRHFRRLRSSQKLLPKRFKNPTISGRLHQCPAEIVSRDYGAELT